MPDKIDITGKRFGRLVAVEPTHKRTTRGLVIWICLCICGNKCKVNGNHLRTGHTKSCGCISGDRRRAFGKSKIPDINGKKFGRLTVIKQSPMRHIIGSSMSVIWECQCDCGRVKLVRSNHLVSGDIRSCGCLQQANRFTKGTNIDPMNVPFEVTNALNARRQLEKAIQQAN